VSGAGKGTLTPALSQKERETEAPMFDKLITGRPDAERSFVVTYVFARGSG